jgi:hypothetical protein
MTHKITPQKIESMRNNLNEIRQASLRATRTGDFMRVARLVSETARLNKSILDGESELLSDM